jgi:hypothetical protein
MDSTHTERKQWPITLRRNPARFKKHSSTKIGRWTNRLFGKASTVNASNVLICPKCGATASDTAKERGRFAARHPAKCEAKRKEAIARASMTKHLASGVRSVEDEELEEVQ